MKYRLSVRDVVQDLVCQVFADSFSKLLRLAKTLATQPRRWDLIEIYEQDTLLWSANNDEETH